MHILVGESVGEIMQYFFHKGGILWAILISQLVILGVHAPVIMPPLQMRNARPIHYSNVSLFKTIELTKKKSGNHVSEGGRVGKKKKEWTLSN